MARKNSKAICSLAISIPMECLPHHGVSNAGGTRALFLRGYYGSCGKTPLAASQPASQLARGMTATVLRTLIQSNLANYYEDRTKIAAMMSGWSAWLAFLVCVYI